MPRESSAHARHDAESVVSEEAVVGVFWFSKFFFFFFSGVFLFFSFFFLFLAFWSFFGFAVLLFVFLF